MSRDGPTLLYPVASLGRGRIGASLPMRPQRRREAREPMAGARSVEESVEAEALCSNTLDRRRGRHGRPVRRDNHTRRI